MKLIKMRAINLNFPGNESINIVYVKSVIVKVHYYVFT